MDNAQAKVYPEKSIAVLPFVNMSADPENEYFSDGITEEIINALTKVPGLKVTARTSAFAFKNKNSDIRAIGQQLGVATVLEGSIRKAKNRIRITAQLIQTQNGFHLWSENFDRELDDIFAVQDEISLLIAGQIRENFGHLEIQEHLIHAPTKNIAAYNLYLKGRYHHLKWDAEGIDTGIACYRQSIEQDPDFALPYFGIGYSYAMQGSYRQNEANLQTAEEFLEKGFQLDGQSYLGYFAKATLSFWGRWDFEAGQQYYLQAIALNPSFTEAEEGLVELYTALGDFDRAMHHTRNILTINPLSPNHYYTKGHIHYLSGDYHSALECMKAALRIDPNFLFAIEMAQLCYLHLKDYDKLRHFQNDYPQAQRPEECRALYKLMHPDEPIELNLSALRSKVREGNTLFPWHLYLQVHLGHHDLALDILEEAVKNRAGQLIQFKSAPLLLPLHAYERFQRLAQSAYPVSALPEEEAPGAGQPAGKPLLSEEEVARYRKAISSLLDKEQLFLDPALGLKTLAEQLGLHPNKLSWLLNEHFGKNFNEFINAYRMESFKAKALDPANSHLTILGLAYESGFNSKTSFNAFFKKMEGKTPSRWLKSVKK
ncbi:MAG TPA: helix-turn-helix domain-containing protein [Saprospiraceae bacterium]|nr:helix-turn-helix domain-containing protein [Saprospiraceae bacterium]